MNETMMTSLLIQLADLGVTGIKIKYDGSGDSGAIEDVLYTIDKLSENEEDAFDAVKSLEPWDPAMRFLAGLDSGLYSDIQNFAEEKILNDIEDWWNNEGGYGSMCILIPSGKYWIQNNVRTIHVDDYYHTGDLINETLD